MKLSDPASHELIKSAITTLNFSQIEKLNYNQWIKIIVGKGMESFVRMNNNAEKEGHSTNLQISYSSQIKYSIFKSHFWYNMAWPLGAYVLQLLWHISLMFQETINRTVKCLRQTHMVGTRISWIPWQRI